MCYLDNDLELKIPLLSVMDNLNHSDDFCEKDQSKSLIKNDNFETELNNFDFASIDQIFEKFKSENDANLSQKEKNNSPNNKTPKILFYLTGPHKELKQKSFLGRKKLNSGEIGKHDRFAQDNMIRTFKSHFKNYLKDFVNSNIKKYIKFPQNMMINEKRYKIIEIKNIKQDQVKDTTVKMNRKLLETTIKDFFSVDIRGNYSNYPKDFNKLLIEKLYNIKNGEKVTCILEKTFLQSLKYFRRDEDLLNDPDYSCLKGLETNFLDFRKEIFEKYGEKYANQMFDLINNFENIYYKKRSRAKRDKKNL